jgi:ABC-type Mn2+/Zn2+ transport system ATPase subunit
VHHLTATVPRGACVAIVGRNGAGKSTLLKATAGLIIATTGSVTLDEHAVTVGDPRLHLLPQSPGHHPTVPLTVADVVAQGRYRERGMWRAFTADDHRIVDEAMTAMALTGLAERPLARLSGGQQQRVRLARALATGADILLLDEPFAGLDPRAANDLAERLKNWVNPQRLVVFATHELDLVRVVASHVLLLNNHAIACGETAATLTDHNLTAALAPPRRAERA